MDEHDDIFSEATNEEFDGIVNEVDDSGTDDEYDLDLEMIDKLIGGGKTVDSAMKKSLLYSFAEDNDNALRVCEEAIDRYPGKPELLAHASKLAAENGNIEKARLYYEGLRQIPCERWTEMAYSFATDYLLYDTVNNKEEIELLIVECKKNFPYNTRIYLTEYLYFCGLNEQEKGIKVLEKAVSTMENAVEPGMQLFELQLKRGLSKQALETGKYLLANTLMLEPVNEAEVCLGMTMARDSILQKKLYMKDKKQMEYDTSEFMLLDDVYETLERDFAKDLRFYLPRIEKKKKILRFMKQWLDS